MSRSSAEGTRDSYKFRFGNVEFDQVRFELSIDGVPVKAQKRPLAVLEMLLMHAGEVVTNEELLETVWRGRVTIEKVVPNAISRLRKLLGAAHSSRIVPVPNVGYRFEGPLDRAVVGQVTVRELMFNAGDPVPGRESYVLQAQIGGSPLTEIWMAQHRRSSERRVFKFCLDRMGLVQLKREVTLSRVLLQALGNRPDINPLLDWNFREAPYFLERPYGGSDLLHWSRDEQTLSLMSRHQRLQLFLQIADAVAAAHSASVLHKDLKPANVLIARKADRLQVSLTDFGSGQLLDLQQLDRFGITRMGLTVSQGDEIGTPLYLAPEIIAGSPATERSDLYALGIMLYQILVGDLRRPIAPGWEQEIDDELLIQDIRESTHGNPRKRMQSATGLADRIRHLDERRRAEAARQEAQRTARRHEDQLKRARALRPWRIAVTALLLAGLTGAGFLYRNALQARDQARTEAQRAEAVLEFLTDDFLGGSDPASFGYDRNPRLRELLDGAVGRVAGRFEQQPLTQARVLTVFGSAYRTLQDWENSARSYRGAATLYAQTMGEAHEVTLLARYRLASSVGRTLTSEGIDEGRHELEEADRTAAGRLEQTTDFALSVALLRADFYAQAFESGHALAQYQKAGRLLERLHPDDFVTAVRIKRDIADSYLRTRQPEEALALIQTVLQDPRADADRIGSTLRASAEHLLARALRNLGRYEEAVGYARSVLEVYDREWGKDTPRSNMAASQLSSIYYFMGDCERAIPLARRVYDYSNSHYPAAAKSALIDQGNFGLKLYDCGERPEGLSLIVDAERGIREAFGPREPAGQRFRLSLAELYVDEGQIDRATSLYEGLDIDALAAGGGRGGLQARLDAIRAASLIDQGRFEEGQALMEAALSVLRGSGYSDDELGTLLRLLSQAQAARSAEL